MSHTQAYSFHEGSNSCDQLNFIISFFSISFFILNLIFGAAFITGLFTCFINVIAYFLSISEHFSTIISPELCLLNLDKFCEPIFYWYFFITCQTHTSLCLFLEGSSSYDLLTFIFIISVTCLFQMFHVNMLFINLCVELIIHFNGLFTVTFILCKSFC